MPQNAVSYHDLHFYQSSSRFLTYQEVDKSLGHDCKTNYKAVTIFRAISHVSQRMKRVRMQLADNVGPDNLRICAG